MFYECNHCGETIKNNGGACYEVGMICVNKKFYCNRCAKEIAVELLDLV